MNRKDVDVHASIMSYREPTPEERSVKMRESPPAANLKAIANAMPDASTPLRLNMIPFRQPSAEGGASVVATVDVRDVAPVNRAREAVGLLMRAFTMDGALRAEKSQNVTVSLTPVDSSADATRPIRYGVVSRLDLAKAGRYTVRIGVSNEVDKTTGSVYADLDVPDFTQTLALSGVAVSSDAGVVAAQADSIRALLPTVPTTDREFPQASHVSTFFRIYEGGRGAVFPVTVKTSIHDQSDTVVFGQSTTYAPERFGTSRSADVAFELPLARLPPSPYLLTFEASGHDKVIERDVIFTVK